MYGPTLSPGRTVELWWEIHRPSWANIPLLIMIVVHALAGSTSSWGFAFVASTACLLFSGRRPSVGIRPRDQLVGRLVGLAVGWAVVLGGYAALTMAFRPLPESWWDVPLVRHGPVLAFVGGIFSAVMVLLALREYRRVQRIGLVQAGLTRVRRAGSATDPDTSPDGAPSAWVRLWGAGPAAEIVRAPAAAVPAVVGCLLSVAMAIAMSVATLAPGPATVMSVAVGAVLLPAGLSFGAYLLTAGFEAWVALQGSRRTWVRDSVWPALSLAWLPGPVLVVSLWILSRTPWVDVDWSGHRFWTLLTTGSAAGVAVALAILLVAVFRLPNQAAEFAVYVCGFVVFSFALSAVVALSQRSIPGAFVAGATLAAVTAVAALVLIPLLARTHVVRPSR